MNDLQDVIRLPAVQFSRAVCIWVTAGQLVKTNDELFTSMEKIGNLDVWCKDAWNACKVQLLGDQLHITLDSVADAADLNGGCSNGDSGSNKDSMTNMKR